MPEPEATHPYRLTPSPGVYAVRDEWNARSLPGAAPARKQLIAKQLHAPSIPATNQSYGYEEAPSGDLTMQAPPPGGFDGVSGHRSVGPGEYEPTVAARWTKPASTAAHFGNSKVGRTIFEYSAKAASAPGPGSYQPHRTPPPGTVAKGRAGGGKPSAAFASRVPLDHQRLLDSEKVSRDAPIAQSPPFQPR
jgi:hypothetical protein